MSERSYKPVAIMPANERSLRRLLCIATSHSPYLSDGEAQSSGIDFMRDSVEEIEAKLKQRAVARLRLEIGDYDGKER